MEGIGGLKVDDSVLPQPNSSKLTESKVRPLPASSTICAKFALHSRQQFGPRQLEPAQL